MSALVLCIEHPLSLLLHFIHQCFLEGRLQMAYHLHDDVSLSLTVGKEAVVGCSNAIADADAAFHEHNGALSDYNISISIGQYTDMHNSFNFQHPSFILQGHRSFLFLTGHYCPVLFLLPSDSIVPHSRPLQHRRSRKSQSISVLNSMCFQISSIFQDPALYFRQPHTKTREG